MFDPCFICGQYLVIRFEADKIQFQYPELFLLAIPLAFAHRRFGLERGFTGLLRITLLVLLLLSLTGPRWNLGGEGIDIVGRRTARGRCRKTRTNRFAS